MTNQKQKNIECIAFQNTRRLPILAEPRMGYENPAESNDFKKYIALTRKLKGFNMRYGEAKINPGFELYPTKKKDSRDWPDEDDSVGGIMMLIDEEAFMRSLEEPESKKTFFW